MLLIQGKRVLGSPFSPEYAATKMEQKSPRFPYPDFNNCDYALSNLRIF